MGRHTQLPETRYRNTVHGLKVREFMSDDDGYGLSRRFAPRHDDPYAPGAVTVDHLKAIRAIDAEIRKMLLWPNPMLGDPKPERAQGLTIFDREGRKVGRFVNTSAITRREDAFGTVSYEFTGRFVEDEDDDVTKHVRAEMQAGPTYFGPGLDNLKGIARARR